MLLNAKETILTKSQPKKQSKKIQYIDLGDIIIGIIVIVGVVYLVKWFNKK
jgi:hypothetical protein